MPAKIRKPVNALTPGDLLASPVWEFALDEEGEPNQDETTVRPYLLIGSLNPSAGMFIVAADFWLADGTKMLGYLTPPATNARVPRTNHPYIVTDRGQVGFWCGACPPEPERAYHLLGRDATSVFPVRFKSVVPFTGGPVAGTVPGFLCLEGDLRTVRVVQ